MCAWEYNLAALLGILLTVPGCGADTQSSIESARGGLGEGNTLASTTSQPMPKAIWQQKGTPTARAFHALAYDSTRDRVVLFGGISGNLRLDDTWEWDGTKWLNVSLDVPLTQRPPARERHALAYDAGRNVVVLFGGRGNGGPLSDTWEWDGTTWTEKTPLDTPLPRSGHALAYDPIRGRVVLFGGQDGSGQALGDTWEWDGENWIEGEGTSPPARFEHALAYDSRALRWKGR